MGIHNCGLSDDLRKKAQRELLDFGPSGCTRCGRFGAAFHVLPRSFLRMSTCSFSMPPRTSKARFTAGILLMRRRFP